MMQNQYIYICIYQENAYKNNSLLSPFGGHYEVGSPQGRSGANYTSCIEALLVSFIGPDPYPWNEGILGFP